MQTVLRGATELKLRALRKMRSLCSVECQYKVKIFVSLTLQTLLMYKQAIFREIKIDSIFKFFVAMELKCSSLPEKLANDPSLSQFGKSL
jgi:hypothetical protein